MPRNLRKECNIGKPRQCRKKEEIAKREVVCHLKKTRQSLEAECFGARIRWAEVSAKVCEQIGIAHETSY
jgi:hypothetical protein